MDVIFRCASAVAYETRLAGERAWRRYHQGITTSAALPSKMQRRIKGVLARPRFRGCAYAWPCSLAHVKPTPLTLSLSLCVSLSLNLSAHTFSGAMGDRGLGSWRAGPPRPVLSTLRVSQRGKDGVGHA